MMPDEVYCTSKELRDETCGHLLFLDGLQALKTIREGSFI